MTPEILDIINLDTDEVVGQAEKPRIYREALPHRIVHIFVYNRAGQILLQRRAAGLSYCPNHWATAACGHVTSGEDYATAGARELQEEIGVTTPLTFVTAPIYTLATQPEFRKRLGVLVGEHEGPFAPSEREVSEVRWFTPAEIDALIASGEPVHPEFVFLWQEYKSKAAPGKTVRVHYTGTLADGSVFDSSRERAPLEFTIGAGQVIVGFDAAVTGLGVGEARTVTMPAAEAYGARRPELIMTIARTKLPNLKFTVGQEMMWPHAGGYTPVRVVAVTEADVTFDANHALAGQDLTFAVELVEIV